MVAHTRNGGASPAKQKLNFHEKLVGKGLSTDALLKKLKTLHAQLAMLDQDHVDVSSLGSARKELINTSLFLHKDRGVKVYAACCLSDVLRLYAPDAPYTQSELRDIFQFFFRQLSNGLKGTDSPYYSEYFHLLESLSTVKSVVLVCDLPTADELIVEIFRDFFSIVRRDLPKKIEIFMADILIALIDESQSLPNELLEITMAQFMDNNAKLTQPAYRLAVHVCTSASDKLQRNVAQYFSDLIVDNSREDDLESIRKAHDLIKRLHQSCPSLLHSVVPQLEEELRVEDVTLRTIATQTLGEMYADKNGSDLIKKFPSTWKFWLGRQNDKSVVIRLKFVETTKALLVALPEHQEELEESLQKKLLDPEDKVRASTCKVYAQIDYETALHHVSEKQLRAIADRGLDKKQSVRMEALNCIGKLYSLALPEIENNDPSAVKHFAWIPDELFKWASANLEVLTVVEQVVADHILPLPTLSTSSTSKAVDVDEVLWTDRLLNMMVCISEKSSATLLTLSGLKVIRPNPYDLFLESCIQNNGGIIDENEEVVTRRLHALVQYLAALFPDSHKAAEDLRTFAKLNENRLYKLLRTIMDPQTDLRTLVKATTDFQKRVEQLSPSITTTMNIYIRRASYRIINQSSIPTLLRRLQKALGNYSSKRSQQIVHHARSLLASVAKHCPALYKSHIGELTKAIADEKYPMLVEVGLQALAGVIKWDESLALTEKRAKERTFRLALQQEPRHAKFATRILAFSKTRDEDCTYIVEEISESLNGSSSVQGLVAKLAGLAQIARYAPNAFEHRSDVVMAYLLKQVLMVPSEASTDKVEDVEEWMEEEKVPDVLKAKILSLKVCRNRCLAHASSENALEIATPVLKMFATILDNNGSLTCDVIEDPKYMSRMRLQAAISLLHLSTIPVYASAMAPRFLRLAVVVQDSCFNVRISFLTKLVFMLQPRKLPPQYNIIPFLTIHDPEMEVKNMASSYTQVAMNKMTPAMKVEYFELIFIRLLHLLAHHPDFNASHEDIKDIAKYVQFYLDLVASPETVSLLYLLTTKGKTVCDADPSANVENFYMICELAQELLINHTRSHSWSIPSYPGKVKLPTDILRPLPNREAVSKVYNHAYLSEETRKWASEASSRMNTQKEKKERKPAAKRKSSTRANGNAKRARKSGKRQLPYDSDQEDDTTSAIDTNDVEMVVVEQSALTDQEANEDSDNAETPSRGTRLSARLQSKLVGLVLKDRS